MVGGIGHCGGRLTFQFFYIRNGNGGGVVVLGYIHFVLVLFFRFTWFSFSLVSCVNGYSVCCVCYVCDLMNLNPTGPTCNLSLYL